jgi:PAS domain S-box-containing protein
MPIPPTSRTADTPPSSPRDDALRHANARFENAQRVARLGSMELNLVSNVITWSDQFFRMIGRKPGDIEPSVEAFIAILHPDDQQEIRTLEDITKQRLGFEPERDLRIMLPNGEVRILRSRSDYVRDDSGAITDVFATFLDVTDHERAQQSLRENEQRFRDIAKTVSDMIWEIDTTGLITYVSPSPDTDEFARQMIELGANLFEKIKKFEAEGGSQTSNDLGMDLFENASPFRNYRTKWHLPDGSQRVWIRNGVPVFNNEGACTGYRISLHDITNEVFSENDLQELQHLAHLGNWRTPQDIDIVTCSPEMLRIFGMDPSQPTHNSSDLLQYIHPDDLPGMLEAIEQHRNGDKDHLETEYRIITLDGELKWVHSRSTTLTDKAGQPTATIGTIQDVTERHNITEELLYKEQRFQDVVAASSDLVWETDTDNNLTYVSDNIETLTGQEKQNIMGQPPWALAMVSEASSGWDTVIEHFEARKPYKNLPTSVTIDGVTTHWSNSGTPIFDADGNYGGIRGSSRDITESVESLAQVELSEAKLHNVLDHAAIGIITIDEQGILQTYNAEAQNIFGYTPEEMLGESVSKLMGGIHARQHHRYISNYLKTGKAKFIGVNNRPETGRHKDGHNIPLELSIAAVTQDGRQSFIASFSDVTEKRETERKFQQAQKMEAVGQMTGGIAHDFNNLLGAMMLNLEMLETEIGNNESELDYLNTIQASVERGAALTRRLLAFSRQQDLETEIIDMNDQIVSLVPLLRQTLPENIDVISHPGGDISATILDPHQLESGILNLAINARDAMPYGGALTLSTANCTLTKQDLIGETQAQPGPYVRVSIADNGTGIAPDILEHILEPFFTTKKQGKGTGLGLSMVYGFVLQSGGHFDIESTEGQGSTFSMYFPAIGGDVKTKPVASQVEKPATTDVNAETILVVEDTLDIQTIVLEALGNAGYNAIGAEHGAAAMAWLDDPAHVPDLLLSDISLLGAMDGTAIARHVLGKYPDCKVILMTGFSGPTLDISSLPDDTPILQKPFSIRELVKVVRDEMNHH